MIVLDASAAVAIVAATQSTAASQSFATTNGDRWIAPAIWAYEVRHGLLRLERKAGLDPRLLDAALARLGQDMQEIEPAMDEAQLDDAMNLARRGGLSFYDACYLELAIRLGAALASRDGQLLEFAARQGVLAIDLR